MKNNDDEIDGFIDTAAHQMVSQMSPKEIGLMIHPDGKPVKLNRVPEDIIQDHLTRYTKKELKRGQFFLVREKYTFIMDHEAKRKRQH